MACGFRKARGGWIFAALLLVSCSSPSNERTPTGDYGDPRTTKPTAEYLENSCLSTADDGEALPATLPESRVAETTFGKKIDRSRLDAIGAASMRATAGFMQADGVSAFHIATNDGGCRALEILPAATSFLSRTWRAAGGPNGLLLGLFLPLSRVNTEQARPVILVRADTDRYTLIHEYMHFLYNREREAHGYDDAAFSDRAQSAQDRWKSVVQTYKAAATPSDELRAEVVDRWLDVSDIWIDLMENYPFEEMSVESLLTEEYRQGRLERVTSYNRDTSIQYIRSMWERANKEMSLISSNEQDVRALIQKASLTDRLPRFEAMLKRYNARMAEGSRLVQKYAGTSVQKKSVFSLGAVTDENGASIAEPQPCSHGEMWDRFKDLDLRIPRK